MVSENDEIRVNSIQAWILAARPKTLSGATVPVIIGISMAYIDTGWHDFQVIPAMLCLVFAWLMQIDSNFINDYFDFIKGNDDADTRLGPKRACAEGWITLPAMRLGLIVTSVLSGVVGLPLIYYGGWEMTIVGAVCVLFAFLYTTFFSYRGLGDMLVLVFFGIVPVCFTYYVIIPNDIKTITWPVFVLSLACGFVIDTLLCINNFRDRENDRRDGKRTLVVRLGDQYGRQLYAFVGIVGISLTSILLLIITPSSNFLWLMVASQLVLFFGYMMLHMRTYSLMKEINAGRELNQVLGMTARNMFFYGVFTALSIVFISL